MHLCICCNSISRCQNVRSIADSLHSNHTCKPYETSKCLLLLLDRIEALEEEVRKLKEGCKDD